MVSSVLWWKRDEYLQGGPCGQYVPQACCAYFHYSQPTFGGFEPIETWTAAVASQKCTHQQWTGPFTTRLLPPTLVPTPFVRYRNVFLPVIATKYLNSPTARSLRLASMGLYLCILVLRRVSPSLFVRSPDSTAPSSAFSLNSVNNLFLFARVAAELTIGT